MSFQFKLFVLAPAVLFGFGMSLLTPLQDSIAIAQSPHPTQVPDAENSGAESGGAENDRTEAERLFTQGMHQFDAGQVQPASETFQQALALYQSLGDRQMQAYALSALGISYDALEQYQQAIDLQQQALEIYRDLGDRQMQAVAINFLGNSYADLEQYQQAIEFYQQSLEIVREIGDQQMEATVLSNLNGVQQSLGKSLGRVIN